MLKTFNRRELMTAAALAVGLPTLSVIAQVADMNDAINKAGRQRMLSQRMSKAWLALGQQVEPTRADKVLADSLSLFDRQLIELKAFSPTPEIRATYAKLETVWSDFKGVLVGAKPATGAVASLLALDGQVLSLANQATGQIEQASGKPLSKLVNMAGRQRMLSQRMAKCHLALAWKSPEKEMREQIASARTEFLAALDTLGAAPQSSASIQQELQLARQQWVFFDQALTRSNDHLPTPAETTNVFVASENILQVMDRITGMYAKAGA